MLGQGATRVLFVDDDPSILDQIRAAATATGRKWDFRFAASGQEALASLDVHGPCDAVVSDLRMPGMDGATLLATIKADFPQTVRIIVSDYRDLSGSLRCLPVAHQFLAAPLDMTTLCDAIERSVDLQRRLHHESLRSAIGDLDVLPSPPLSVVELNRALSRPDASIDDVAQVIARDPAMTAKLLQLVNSAFFGLRHRVTNAHHAVSYLGLATVRNLLTAVELVRAFTPPSVELVEAVEQIHTHSLSVAERARSLMAHRHGIHDAFAAGMMHEVGLLALISHAPEKFLHVRDEIARGRRPADACEIDILGATHAQLGACLLSMWGLPYSLVEAVARSHDADRLQDRTMSPVHAVFIAEQLTNVLGAPCGWEHGRIPDHDYLMDLGIADEVQLLMSRSIA